MSVRQLLALLLVTFGFAQVTDARELKIAAWNLEHLAQVNDSGCKPRTAADYRLARQYAERLNADIIGLSEVENKSAAERVFDPQQYNIEISRQRLRAGYVCDRNNPESKKSTKQLTGFAIRKDIKYRRNPDFAALDVSENSSLRAGTDITLLAPKALRLLSVHLKANCPSKDLGSNSRDCQVLARQQPILEEQWIEARHRSNEAFIVLGDFNRHLSQEGDQFWAATDDGTPQGLKMQVLKAGNEALCVRKYPKRIDHIVVGGAALNWVKSNSFSIFTFEVEGEPSDHCPISAVFDMR